MSIAILIPSYDRPDLLKIALHSWLSVNQVSMVLVVAEASTSTSFQNYQEVLSKYSADRRVVTRLTMNRLGSVKARNVLLDMARENDCSYALMVDDDYVPVDKQSVARMKLVLNANKAVLVGGKIIVAKRRRVDPDFFLNLPLPLADQMTKITGYIFLDTVHGPKFCEYLPHFFMIPKELLSSNFKYDERFDTPTGFREESDFQAQVKQHGYRLIFNPNTSVLHLAVEIGGDRPKMAEAKRIYWKARNHQMFIIKWNKSISKRFLYTMFSFLILVAYRIWYIRWIALGISDGFAAGLQRIKKTQRP